MRIIDWSSDVCSSYLGSAALLAAGLAAAAPSRKLVRAVRALVPLRAEPLVIGPTATPFLFQEDGAHLCHPLAEPGYRPIAAQPRTPSAYAVALADVGGTRRALVAPVALNAVRLE